MSSGDNLLDELLACPRCDSFPLESSSTSRHCKACKTRFPLIGGIPWLFAEPEASLGDWRNRLHFELQRLAQEVRQLEVELDGDGLSPLTRVRLERQLAATGEHRQALRQLLAPLDIQPLQASYESHLALRTRLPRDQGLNTYYHNVHRDWAWGETENKAAMEALRKVIGEEGDLGDTLVLGAGACRLAYDLHMNLRCKRLVALDFNPLLLLVARIMASGNALELHEFPIAPRTSADYAVLRTLNAPQPARDGFILVLADVLRAPFKPGAFDTVVTPWLVDIVAEDFPVLAARINRLLKPGGRWLNSGSLAFEHPRHACRYSLEEVVEAIEQAGFRQPVVSEETIPYMCSPASRHGRREAIVSFSATKATAASPPARHRALPDWIVTGKEPVPLSRSFSTQAMSTRIYAYVMSLIDGERSIEDMATLLEQQKLMPREEALPAIRNFLTRMYDDSQRF